MQNVLETKHLTKYYGAKDTIVKALDGIDLEIAKKDFIAVMGPSGSGKSTLLNVLSLIDSATSGLVEINKVDVKSLSKDKAADFRRKNIGFIFQDYNMLDALTIRENISLPLSINKIKSAEIKIKTETIAKKLGIFEQLDKYPYQVSGGQRQRAAACRAIVGTPNIIFADEPTGALDSKSSQALLMALETINQDIDATILMVTHDAFAASYSKKVIFIKDGKIFNTIEKGEMSKKEYFKSIMNVISVLEGGVYDAE